VDEDEWSTFEVPSGRLGVGGCNAQNAESESCVLLT